MARRFSGKVVVVTGASSGVGRTVAEAFGAEGASVALLARNPEALDHAATQIAKLGGRALALPTDVSDAEAVERAAEAVDRTWGHIDVWVNDAMISVFAPASQIADAEFERVTQVNYLGAVYGTQAALRRMTPRNAGIVVQIGSALAYCSIPLQSAYCASKAALRGYTDSVRIELEHARSRVKICILQLPAVNTPQFDVVRNRLPNRPEPVPPIFQPEVIGRAVLYAAEHGPRELWLGVPAWKAILGRFFAPRFTDWYLARTGYRSQQTAEPAQHGRPDNIDAFIPGDRGAHGRFDARAHGRSSAIWLRLHPWTASAAVAGLIGAGWLARRA